MSKQPLALTMWGKLADKPGGKWLFSKAIAQKAPYFSTINPKFEELAVGRVVVTSKLRRAVTNHIGTFHAIAMCNMAEVAGGLLTEISIPQTHRWIPKGMTVQYLKKAETNLRAVAEVNPLPKFAEGMDWVVPVDVYDTRGQIVFHADITMRVSPKK